MSAALMRRSLSPTLPHHPQQHRHHHHHNYRHGKTHDDHSIHHISSRGGGPRGWETRRSRSFSDSIPISTVADISREIHSSRRDFPSSVVAATPKIVIAAGSSHHRKVNPTISTKPHATEPRSKTRGVNNISKRHRHKSNKSKTGAKPPPRLSPVTPVSHDGVSPSESVPPLSLPSGKKSRRHRRRGAPFYAGIRRSAAAVRRSELEESLVDPMSRLDLDRYRLQALMADAGLTPLDSHTVTREDLLRQQSDDVQNAPGEGSSSESSSSDDDDDYEPDEADAEFGSRSSADGSRDSAELQTTKLSSSVASLVGFDADGLTPSYFPPPLFGEEDLMLTDPSYSQNAMAMDKSVDDAFLELDIN